jgi:hypothetical protein
MAKSRYEVVVSRINEPAHAGPYETVIADHVEITPDGSLYLSWGKDGKEGRFFSFGLWDGIKVTVLRPET